MCTGGVTPPVRKESDMTEALHKTKPNYVGVFWILIIFTLLEVGVTRLPFPKLPTAFFLVALAMTKALLVAMYYMHLKFETRLLILIAGSPFLFAVILTLALMPDIAFRR